jgi:hypothetical protein
VPIQGSTHVAHALSTLIPAEQQRGLKRDNVCKSQTLVLPPLDSLVYVNLYFDHGRRRLLLLRYLITLREGLGPSPLLLVTLLVSRRPVSSFLGGLLSSCSGFFGGPPFSSLPFFQLLYMPLGHPGSKARQKQDSCPLHSSQLVG